MHCPGRRGAASLTQCARGRGGRGQGGGGSFPGLRGAVTHPGRMPRPAAHPPGHSVQIQPPPPRPHFPAPRPHLPPAVTSPAAPSAAAAPPGTPRGGRSRIPPPMGDRGNRRVTTMWPGHQHWHRGRWRRKGEAVLLSPQRRQQLLLFAGMRQRVRRPHRRCPRPLPRLFPRPLLNAGPHPHSHRPLLLVHGTALAVGPQALPTAAPYPHTCCPLPALPLRPPLAVGPGGGPC